MAVEEATVDASSARDGRDADRFIATDGVSDGLDNPLAMAGRSARRPSITKEVTRSACGRYPIGAVESSACRAEFSVLYRQSQRRAESGPAAVKTPAVGSTMTRPTTAESRPAHTAIRRRCRSGAVKEAQSADLGRRADRSRDAGPDKALGHGERVPGGTRHLGLLNIPHVRLRRREGVPDVPSVACRSGRRREPAALGASSLLLKQRRKNPPSAHRGEAWGM